MNHPDDSQGRPCIACTDPDRYTAWQAHQRHEADQCNQWAVALRAAGQVMGERSRWAAVRGDDNQDFDVLKVRLCGDANALQAKAHAIRDRLEAIAAAHLNPIQTTLT